MPWASSRAAHCMSSVDFPMPGSPPTSVTEPGTMPPPSTKSNSATPAFHRASATPFRSVRRMGEALARWTTGPAEFDFVLGGGIVPGSVTLVGGEPGIGKSTLLMQCAARLEAQGIATLYVSGEESPDQLRLRADRLQEDAGGIHVLG